MGEESASRGAAKSPPWQEDREAVESFGSWLKKHRKGRSIQLQEISEHTKISIGILQALEEDRTDALPARVFVHGFLRQYAGFVGLDPEEVVTHYAGSHPLVEDETLRVRADRSDDSGAWMWIAVAVLLAAAAAGYWFFGRSPAGSGQPPPAAETVVESTLVTVPPPPVTDPGGQSEPEAGTVEPAPAAGAATAESAGEGETNVAPAATDATAAMLATPFRVTIDFVEDCWVESMVDGERQISTLYAKGESLRLEAEEHVRVFLGNYSGAEVHINGQPFVWPQDAAAGNTRELEVDAEFIAALRGDTGERSPDPDEQASIS